jgi:hypothetical protein
MSVIELLRMLTRSDSMVISQAGRSLSMPSQMRLRSVWTLVVLPRASSCHASASALALKAATVSRGSGPMPRSLF